MCMNDLSGKFRKWPRLRYTLVPTITITVPVLTVQSNPYCKTTLSYMFPGDVTLSQDRSIIDYFSHLRISMLIAAIAVDVGVNTSTTLSPLYVNTVKSWSQVTLDSNIRIYATCPIQIHYTVLQKKIDRLQGSFSTYYFEIGTHSSPP